MTLKMKCSVCCVENTPSTGGRQGRDLEGPDLGHTKRLVDIVNLF